MHAYSVGSSNLIILLSIDCFKLVSGIQYTTLLVLIVSHLLFLPRLELLCKVGCVLHVCLYEEPMFLFSSKVNVGFLHCQIMKCCRVPLCTVFRFIRVMCDLPHPCIPSEVAHYLKLFR